MGNVLRDFYVRDKDEQEWMLQNTWCDTCNKADLGIINPKEFEEEGTTYLTGNCTICGQKIYTEINNE